MICIGSSQPLNNSPMTRIAVFNRRGLHGLIDHKPNRCTARHRLVLHDDSNFFTLSSLDVCGGGIMSLSVSDPKYCRMR